MENPTFYHLLAFLYIGFGKLSNNDIPLEQEMAIKRKIAQWMDLSFRNVDQYEMVMRQTLEWFNSVKDKPKDALMSVAATIAKLDNIDDIMLKKILSEVRDVAVSNGKFDQGEKVLHDEIAATMGINIVTIDDHCGPLETLSEEQQKEQKENSSSNQEDSGSIGFKYGEKKKK